jgi:MFS family permease
MKGPLRERNFRLLFLARGSSYFGSNLAPIAVAFGVLDIGGSPTAVGVAFAAWTLAQVSTLLVGGVVADRLPRRLVMIASDGANAAIRIAMGALLVSGHAEIWELVVLQALGGAATAFYSPASTGLVPETVHVEQLQQANGLMSISRYAAFPAGAAVGGAIVATLGPGYALLLDAGTYVTSAALLAAMAFPRAARSAAAKNFVRELAEGWHAFTEHTWVWLLTGWISFYFLITYAPFFVLGPYIAKQSMGGAGAWATVVTGEAVGALLGGIVGLRVRPRRAMLAIGALFAVTALQSALLALNAPFLVIAAAAVLAGFAFSYGTVVWDTSLQRMIAPDKLSRVSAYNWMGAMAFLPAGYAVAGPVSELIGISTYLWIGAGWIVVSTLAVMVVRDVREFTGDADEPHQSSAPVPA